MCRLLLFALSSLIAGTVHAAELEVVEKDSTFAIVTHKAGMMSGKAHNHLVAAGAYAARLEASADDAGGTVFEIELTAKDLVVDAPALQESLYPRLEALGILEEPFGKVEEEDREKVRESMLGVKQLDAERFPRIRARITGVAEKAAKLGETEMPYEVGLAFEVHGKSVERPVAARASWDEAGALQVEAAGIFRFTDFGIEPFSAFLGAVRNTDEFHVYVSLRAVKR